MDLNNFKFYSSYGFMSTGYVMYQRDQRCAVHEGTNVLIYNISFFYPQESRKTLTIISTHPT